MEVNFDSYKEKALEACQQVFDVEYKRSIGIPLPEIKFILPDSPNYSSGNYYIKISDTWQIHLNFGLLPKSYKEFQEEVRVLTRHEVEHYMCCPFDVLTHLRLLKAIIDTYNKDYSHHLIDIVKLSGNIANQAADVIIDTKNFYRHRDETLKSERAWIKKGGSDTFKNQQRHAKLMFLTKEAIWREDLELYEEDESLKEEVRILAEKFNDEGITNKDLFILKFIEYTHTFFKLFEQDKLEDQQQDNSDSTSGDSNSQPQTSSSKDASENGSPFIFQSPDKIKEALIEFAQETSLEQFSEIVSAAGINSLSNQDKQKIWFDAQNADIIPIIEEVPKGSKNSYTYPTAWKLGDPLEEMDLMLSYAISPVIIPGVTTKKWIKNSSSTLGTSHADPDLLLLIDTSGSMGKLSRDSSNIHQAIIASFGILKYLESKQRNAALLGFSDRISAFVDWTDDYDYLREQILINGSGGTKFPTNAFERIIEDTKNPLVTVVITDGEIQNSLQTINSFEQYLAENNKLFLFLQDRKSFIENYKHLKSYGAKIFKALSAKDMRDAVLHELL